MHTAHLMPLPLTVSCFSKVQIGFTFLVPAHPGSPGKRAVKRVCVCVCPIQIHSLTRSLTHSLTHALTHSLTHSLNQISEQHAKSGKRLVTRHCQQQQQHCACGWQGTMHTSCQSCRRGTSSVGHTASFGCHGGCGMAAGTRRR